MNIAGMARPARLGDDKLRIMVEEGTAINETARLYTAPMFMIYRLPDILLLIDHDIQLLGSTNSVSVLL